tara:strand:- start:52 stop:615 length:564 start_codon:yes stop_codon:yes gene_type:complete
LNSLPREFYLENTVSVAKKLLGKKIIRRIGNNIISGIITETEAYRHKDDPASHAFTRMTERNKVMFGEVGIAYVYFTYGMHYCFNVVAKNPKTKAGAVLIRAIEPEKGIKTMQKNRKMSDLKNLTNGPAKLAQALNITKEQYGVDLTKNPKLFITNGIKSNKITASSRIGIRKSIDKLWNFKIDIKN